MRAGFKQPSYPFDDIFSNIDVAAHCLANDFSVFLDRANCLPVAEPHKWVQRHYRENLGVWNTFNHHDMSRDESWEKFKRRVARFRALEDPAFVYMEFANIIGSPLKIASLRRAIHQRFPDATLLIYLLGEGLKGAEHMRLPRTNIRRLKIGSPCTGVGFVDTRDDCTLVSALLADQMPDKIAA